MFAFLISLVLASLSGPIAFTHVNVIDVVNGTVQEDMTLILDGERIAALGTFSTLAVPPNAEVIDASGKYVMPGLWDMHIHPDDPEMWPANPSNADKELFLAPMIAYGVTGARDMGGDLKLLLSWKSRIAKGELIGPRLVVGGPLVDGPEPMWPGSVAVSTPEQARRAVDSLQQAGVDFVKVYSLIPREAFFALAERAKERNITFAGHIPRGVSPLEASEAGMADLEHMVTFPFRPFKDDAKEAAYLETLGPNPTRIDYFKAMMRAYDSDKARAMFRQIKANGTWVVPSLEVTRANAYFEAERGTEKIRFHSQHIPPHVRTHWLPANNPHLGNRDPGFIEASQERYGIYVKMMGDMHAEGIQFLPGTDIGGNVHLFPGYSLHRELENFVEAGLTPAEALRTATYNPALFLGRDADLGTVQAGKIADLLFTDENPLDAITNTQTVWATVANGVHYDRVTLDAMLAEVAAH